MTTPPLDPATRQEIAARVCVANQADGLEPHEVDVRDDGEIWVDRRGRDRRNVPFHLGRWSR